MYVSVLKNSQARTGHRRGRAVWVDAGQESVCEVPLRTFWYLEDEMIRVKAAAHALPLERRADTAQTQKLTASRRDSTTPTHRRCDCVCAGVGWFVGREQGQAAHPPPSLLGR